MSRRDTMRVAPAIAVDSLTKRFGARTAVENLSFEVPWRSVTGFIGPNGSGKTTTLRVLLGLAAATAGSALIAGRHYRELTSPLRMVGAVLEQSGCHPGRTAADNLRVAAMYAGLDARRVYEVLDLVELSGVADVRSGAFSQGMRQRLSLAMALLGEPEILVLDEPLNGLDPDGVRWFRSFIRDMQADGHTVFVSSHILSELYQVVDHVVVLSGGSVVISGPVASLAGGPRVVVRAPDAARLARVLRARGGTVRSIGGNGLTVEGLGIEAVGSLAATNGFVVHELRLDSLGSLEDVVLSVFEAEGSA